MAAFGHVKQSIWTPVSRKDTNSATFDIYKGASKTDDLNVCGGGGCIVSMINGHDAPSIVMHLYVDILLDGFEAGKSMNL
jgi:hypothetical protein